MFIKKRISCGAKSLTFSSHPSWDFQGELYSASWWTCLLWGSLQTCPVSTHRTHLSPGMLALGPLWLIHLSLVGLGLILQTVWTFFKILFFLLKPLQSIPQLWGSQRTKQDASWSNYNRGLHVGVGCSLGQGSLWRSERKAVLKSSSSSTSSVKPSRTSITQVLCCQSC